MKWRMKAMLPLIALALVAPLSAAPAPRMYLVSITGLGLGPDEYIDGFKLQSWGVRYKAVCRIPAGWLIKAGSSTTAAGWLEGEGSHGITWLRRGSESELHGLVLVTLDAGQNWNPVRDSRGGMLVPPTLYGDIVITNGKADRERKLGMTRRNFRFVPARACPPPR